MPNRRPHRQGKKQTDEATDTYDTVDWLLKNVPWQQWPVGVMGISYPGFYATMATLAGTPGHQSRVATGAGDGLVYRRRFSPQRRLYAHGRLFLLFRFWQTAPTSPPRKASLDLIDWKTPDNYDFYLHAGALRNYNERYGMKDIPFWNDLMAHPDYNAWWQARNPRPHLKNVLPAVMTVGGLFDAEDCWGAWNTYKAIEKQNPPSLANRLVMGPWVHGGWARGNGDRLGNVVFGSKTSDFTKKKSSSSFSNTT